MKKFKIKTKYRQMLADTFTPVNIYLKLRDKFPFSFLLESSDYHSNENSFSFICSNPVASFKIQNEQINITYPDGSVHKQDVAQRSSVLDAFNDFTSCFESEKLPFKFIGNGLFGYIAYDAIRYFEDLELDKNRKQNGQVPDIYYNVYQYVIAINHFNNELYIIENNYSESGYDFEDSIDTIVSAIKNKNIPEFKFNAEGIEASNLTDEQYLDMVAQGKRHCFRGNVFQVVLSREFTQKFKGDEFNVYRSLRSINPSPYLFYFDFGDFKLFGSSPEAQIVIKNRKASIFPIAGTFRRTGDDHADAALADKLKEDPKENAEHIMLVDLARNDLSRNCSNVVVENYREIQFYSHVIHLVSKVSGTVKGDNKVLQVVADTFPAGTLSGAPKYKAMQLIDKYEPTSRRFYGGCIGFLGFDGSFNHAIIIRSFLSKNNILHYRAGAGIVAASDDVSELDEVNNKLMALKKAIEMAKTI